MVITAQDTQIKVGYKLTEVGVIPEDWEVKKLGNLGRVIRGASPRPQGDRRYYGGSIPRLMVEDVTRDGKYITPKVDFLTVEGAKRSRPCKKGTLTIVCSGTVGIPSFLAVDACIHDGFLALVDINKKYVSEDYLYHQLMRLRDKFEISATHGGVFTNLTTSILYDFQTPLPPLPEQQAIATALSDVDALITSLDKLIAKKRDIKQATMQQLLTGKMRLPGFSKGPKQAYKQTEVGMIPEDWEVKKLGEIAKISRGASPRPIEDPKWFDEHSNIGWVRISDVTKSAKYLFSTVQNLSEQGVKQSRFVKQENLIMSICATVGKPIITKIDVCIHDGFVIFEKPKVSVEYLYYYLSSIENNWSKNGQTGSQMNLNTTIIGNENISFPNNPEEQQAIATVLSDMDAEIAALEQKRDKTRALKQGMMQELLTGKTRLVTS
jgi:type I restriction enzyme S subunit